MIEKLLLFLTDWELFRKPKSTQIRISVVNDILTVDPAKWFHPKLLNGKTSKSWGTIETVNGRLIFKEGDVDLYIYEHPDIKYRIIDSPLLTYKEGELNNLTKKDCRIIRDVLYTSKDKAAS